MVSYFDLPLHENISYLPIFLYSLSSMSAGLYVFSSSFICSILSVFIASLVERFSFTESIFLHRKSPLKHLCSKGRILRVTTLIYHSSYSVTGTTRRILLNISDVLLQSYLPTNFLERPFSLWIFLSGSSFMVLLFFLAFMLLN